MHLDMNWIIFSIWRKIRKTKHMLKSMAKLHKKNSQSDKFQLKNHRKIWQYEWSINLVDIYKILYPDPTKDKT